MSEWMLWGRFGGSVQLGSAPPPRLYLIPFTTSIEAEGSLAPELGHRNRSERNLEDFTRALDRAASAESDGVIFPGAFALSPLCGEVVTRARNRRLRIVHQVTADTFMAFPLLFDALKARLEDGDALNLVFGGDSNLAMLSRFERWTDQVYFTYSVRASDEAIALISRLTPFVRERLFFHFPFHLEFRDGRLSCQDVYELGEQLRTQVPDAMLRPMLGTEVYDPRVDPELELEPVHKPLIELRSSAGQDHATRVPIEVSVIIPSYNNRDYLVNTIQHLTRQDLPRRSFEIIVVDDGSDDGTRATIEEWTNQHRDELNFKYIYSPRSKPRKMGDANYRAGISRNLGVKNANGRILCFLDSDILTPANFLSDLIEKHRHYDVIQCKRLNLISEKSDAVIRYEDVQPNTDIFSTEGDYWDKFYALRDWSAVPFFWKYTCTYGLSIPAQLFKRVGWIRRGFIFYGFEDVELGYRLARVGARFHLNNMITYHLFHRNERSEFRNSDFLRQSLLAKTAQIFYLGTLDSDVFLHFRGSMKEQIQIRLPERLQERLEPFKKPLLALWNWRIVLWRFTQKFWWLRVLRDRAMSHSWRIPVLAGVAAKQSRSIAMQASYPLRKIYYFGSYQWDKRVRRKTNISRESV